MTMKHRVWLEINLGTLVANYRRIAAHVKPAKVLCVLKANAYGLGVAEYARALAGAGCRNFGVAEPYEAMELKELFAGGRGRPPLPVGRDQPAGRDVLGAPPEIQILSSILPDEIPAMAKAGVTLPVIDFATAKLISAAAVKAKTTARVHFKLDTGMGRLGILATGEGGVERAVETMLAAKALPGIVCEGVFSHFPVAFDPKDPFTRGQISLFRRILAAAEKKGLSFRNVHLAASDGINNFPECARPPFTMVRTGINLHGSFDPNGRRALKVEPVLSLKTRVAQVRELPAGTTLGYGRTWCLNAPTRIATISAGYADGLPLALANRGSVFVGGRRCKIVGRISMDYTTVDVSGVPDVKAGDEVVCFGRCGRDSITPDDWAALKGTHAYDIICSLGNRVQRVTTTGASR